MFLAPALQLKIYSLDSMGIYRIMLLFQAFANDVHKMFFSDNLLFSFWGFE